jgi:hypothetical protein
MIENLVQQFMGSGAFGQAVDALKGQHGLDDQQARGAVQATAEGTAEAMKSGGGGLGGLLGGLTGGGGLGGLAGMLGGGSAGGAGGLPPQLVDTVANFVAGRTGLDDTKARAVVAMVLPKVIDFAKSKFGGGKGGGLFG